MRANHLTLNKTENKRIFQHVDFEACFLRKPVKQPFEEI